MADQELRDRSGRLVGKTRELPDGRLEGRDARGNLCGHYDSDRNETRDRSGNLVGKGNLLATLITN
ncbi:MAG: hypothetical protein EOP84_14935 [Verrucomicrobiaceae bacterium]|nr:MAG: hypothetical protein EOP84_14935 [Verrucomicrobiaceae bacterium]